MKIEFPWRIPAEVVTYHTIILVKGGC